MCSIITKDVFPGVTVDKGRAHYNCLHTFKTNTMYNEHISESSDLDIFKQKQVNVRRDINKLTPIFI